MPSPVTPRPSGFVRAINSLRPAVKLGADDVKPDTEVAQAIVQMVNGLKSSMKTFGDWETQIGQTAWPKEWNHILQAIQRLKNDTEEALHACSGMHRNQQQLTATMIKILQSADSSIRRRLRVQGFGEELQRISGNIANQSSELLRHSEAMRECAERLQQDINSALGENAKRSAALRRRERLAKWLQRIFKACAVVLEVLSAVSLASPVFGIPAAAAGGVTGLVLVGLEKGAGRMKHKYSRQLDKDPGSALKITAQDLKTVIEGLGRIPKYQSLLQAETALSSGRVVRMQNRQELEQAMDAWKKQEVVVG